MENQKFEQTKVVECILCNKWVIRKSGPKHLHTNHKKYMMNIPDPLYDELFQECNAVEEFHKISKITNFFDNKKMIIELPSDLPSGGMVGIDQDIARYRSLTLQEFTSCKFKI